VTRLTWRQGHFLTDLSRVIGQKPIITNIGMNLVPFLIVLIQLWPVVWRITKLHLDAGDKNNAFETHSVHNSEMHPFCHVHSQTTLSVQISEMCLLPIHTAAQDQPFQMHLLYWRKMMYK
jgi:hypothetical protein